MDFGCHFAVFSPCFWAGVESVIFDDTTAYNHYFESRGDVIWHHFGTVFLEGCCGRLFCDFLMFFGVPGVSLWSSRAPLGAP